jgi:hypothetical protein
MARQICQEYPRLSAASEAGSPINPVAAGGATPKPLKRAWLRGALPFGTALFRGPTLSLVGSGSAKTTPVPLRFGACWPLDAPHAGRE